MEIACRWQVALQNQMSRLEQHWLMGESLVSSAHHFGGNKWGTVAHGRLQA